MMKSRQSLYLMIAFVGMLLLIVFAYGIDSWREYTKAYYSETFSNLFEIKLSYVITNIVLSALICAWSWFVIVKLNQKRWKYLILLIPGILITMSPLLYFSPIGFLYFTDRISPEFQIFLTSGIITMIGLLKIAIRNNCYSMQS
jgi:hypothetical protein